ncbi:hypothetical protein [Wielerella bovis]|uniref:hypothetical protein n=1 Tax=Wielerella bovis TaxID=2917790 RepID=UPI00201909FD|nr:hypothetical protein [Wielerella bovis]ULJ61069.1 hypothetical protein MIS44_04225 [Wielerella bovis]
MFKPYEPTPTPVKVYRASDMGAPQLKREAGSLKTLIKTCLINGYGEGVNRKEPVGGWKMFEETAHSVTFHSDKTYSMGLKIENDENYFIKAYMVGGERFAQYVSYANREINNFSYNHDFAMKNWLLVGCESGFMLVLPQDTQNSQILYFGRLHGLYEDTGNVVYVNTSYMAQKNWDTGNFGDARNPILTVRSQWRDGGTLPLVAVECEALSPFAATNVKYPDALYQNTTASAIVLAEKGGAVRGTLPALFWCYHDLQNVVDDLDFVAMADGQQYIKLNISDQKDSRYCFVLNVDEWVL